MSLTTAIQSLGGDLNITKLVIDKNFDMRGRPAVMVEFEYDTADGRRIFHTELSKDLKLDDNARAALIVDAARKHANKAWLEWEQE